MGLVLSYFSMLGYGEAMGLRRHSAMRDSRHHREVDDGANGWDCGVSGVRGEGGMVYSAVVVGLGYWAALGECTAQLGCRLGQATGVDLGREGE